MSNNCVNINGKMINVPFRSYAGCDLTDYRPAYERDNEIFEKLKDSGCNSNNSYNFKNCMVNKSLFVKELLDKNFNNSLRSDVCKRQ